jgi:hypothetical protein
VMKPPRPRNFDDVSARLDRLDRELSQETLDIREQIGAMAAELANLRTNMSFSATPPPPQLPPAMRDPESSIHDFDEDIARFRETLRQKSRRDSVRARALAKEAVASAQRDEKAASWDKLVHTGWRIFVGIAVGVIVTIVIYRLGMR